MICCLWGPAILSRDPVSSLFLLSPSLSSFSLPFLFISPSSISYPAGLLKDTYWKTSGPLFFYTGNEGPIEQFYSNSGYVFVLAKEFNALVVFAEHVSHTGDSHVHVFLPDSLPPFLPPSPPTSFTHSLPPSFPQRYYGKSLPFGSSTFEPENMGYLSVEQALADYAVVVEGIRTEFNIAKVISFGGR